MSEWNAKRFWEAAEVVEDGGRFSVTLDGQDVKTPAKQALRLPSFEMAEAVAAEWRAQGEKIDPMTMPVTRSANAALDKVSVQHSEVADLIAAYGGSDLICYRADGPVGLVARQCAVWDPLVDWSATKLNAPLAITTGVMPIAQAQTSMDIFRAKTGEFDAFRLTAFHDLVSLSGSLVIGFAVIYDHLPIEDAWDASRIDETWQIEQWGEDEEASEQAALKRAAFVHANRFFRLC